MDGHSGPHHLGIGMDRRMAEVCNSAEGGLGTCRDTHRLAVDCSTKPIEHDETRGHREAQREGMPRTRRNAGASCSWGSGLKHAERGRTTPGLPELKILPFSAFSFVIIPVLQRLHYASIPTPLRAHMVRSCRLLQLHAGKRPHSAAIGWHRVSDH